MYWPTVASLRQTICMTPMASCPGCTAGAGALATMLSEKYDSNARTALAHQGIRLKRSIAASTGLDFLLPDMWLAWSEAMDLLSAKSRRPYGLHCSMFPTRVHVLPVALSSVTPEPL